MKKLLSILLLVCFVLGTVQVPVNAASKSATKTKRVNGVLVPIGKNWIEQGREDGLIVFSEKEDLSDGLVYVAASQPTKTNADAKKLAKLLNKKSSKSKVYKALKKLEIMSGAEFTKNNISLKKESNGKYMVILSLSMNTETDYLVFRNVDDRFLVLYGAGLKAGAGELSSKTKKTILKNAKKIVPDEIGMSLTLMNEIVIPYPDEWKMRDRYSVKEDDYEAALFEGDDIDIEIRVDYADSDDDTKKVAALLSDKANLGKIEQLLTELLQIPDDMTEEYPYKISFSMESDGHGSNYILLDAGVGCFILRVIDGKYIMMIEVMNISGEALDTKMRDKIIKTVNGTFIE